MKLFDYKFLILLGLTLVVYFIYREILDLKHKVNSMETEIKQLETKSEKNPKKSIQNKKEEPKQINFQIPLPSPPKEEVEIPKLLHNQNCESESELEISQSGERLEIYSNDNDKTLSFSIGESSILNSDEVDEVNNNEIQLENDDEELSKKKTILVKSEGDDDEQLESNEISSVNSRTDFMKLKLSELQCIAEENNINIKKEKGKKKTKSELSKEISELFSKKNPSVI